MRVRSWFIRGLILAGVAALAALAWLANSWVSPERVREKVIATLSEQFADVDVHVGSARMRILGGIAVSDIKLTRRGDPADRPFLSVPSAVLYHDKEQLNRGRLVIKKVELDAPVFTMERSAGGEWNVLSAMKPGPADRPVPTFVVKNGSVTVTDRAPGALPPLALTNLQLTLLNDPLPTLTVQAGATAANYGPVAVRARYNKLTRHLSLNVEAPELPLGPAVQSAVKRAAPDLAPHLAKLTATANVRAELTYAPGGPGPHWKHDVRFSVKDAHFEHPDVPIAVEKLSASVRSVDGRIKVEEASALIGGTKVRLSLETRGDGLPALALQGANDGGDPLKAIEDNLQKLEVHATDLPLSEALFDQLPPQMRRARKQFNPTGHVDVTYKFGREGAGWKRDLEVRPKQAGLLYEKFRYPLADVRGLLKRVTTHTGEESVTIDLVGTAGGQFVTIKGRADGPGPDPAVNLTVTGLNAPLNDDLVNALPPKFAAMVRQFRASGRGDFVAKITQQPGVNLLENEFRIDIKDAKVNYTRFPYPVEQVKGRVVVRTTMTDATRPVRPGEPLAPLPDRDEMILDGITAVHGGAQVWMNGAKRPLPDSRDRKLVLKMGGTNLPVDADMRTALAAVRVESGWDALAPSGKLSFSADVEVLDRAPPVDRPDDDTPFDPARDMALTFNFAGPTVKPTFLAYEVTDLTGWLQYKNNRLDVAHLTGKHGPTRLKLSAAELRFYPDGAVWANIGAGEMKPFVADDELRKALPSKLASALGELQLKGGAELHLKHMAVVPAGGGEPPLPAPAAKPDPVIYWDAELKLFGASLDTGVPWEDVYGSVASRGRYEGTHLGAVRGNVWLDRATVSRLPVSSARCQLRVDSQSPDLARPGTFQPPVLQFLNATGDLFHGELVGQARVALTDPPRYEVWASVSNAQLDEAARHYKLGSDADLKGIAQAQLLVYNRPDPKTGQLVVEGNGKIDVPTGRMYNLPILLDLVKVLKLQTPDKTAFEQAHAVFRIQGDRVKVEQIDLIGKAICVGGSGELDTSGEFVKFEFYTVWSQVLKQLINTPVGDLTAFLSKNLFVIKMTRENGELKYKPEAVPLVTEPTKAVIDRLKRGASKVMGK
jgi:hypothetical protein